MNIRRLIGGLSFLVFLTGGLLVCFVRGGLLNPHWFQVGGGVSLDQPGHIAGFVLLGLGAIGFVVLFSLNKPAPAVHRDRRAPDGEALTPFPIEREEPPSPHIRR